MDKQIPSIHTSTLTQETKEKEKINTQPTVSPSQEKTSTTTRRENQRSQQEEPEIRSKPTNKTDSTTQQKLKEDNNIKGDTGDRLSMFQPIMNTIRETAEPTNNIS